MKLLIALVFVLGLVTAAPADNLRNVTAFTSLLAVDKGYGIGWTGVIFPGEPETSLWGYVDEIYAEILAINPNYVPEPIETANNNNMLAKRDTIKCAQMATGYFTDLSNMCTFHRKIGGWCRAPANQCRRTACWATSATYLCGEYGSAINIPCRDLAEKIHQILYNCCGLGSWSHRLGGAPGGKLFGGKSGSLFSGTHSVWVGYGNCRHVADIWPSGYRYPGGKVNGLCIE
ncbi:hypothetical protein QBC38DRAFT_466046 [Podospora fimiseda]|uniref:Secreted protein n=1 Tax=Podospora fimiseda TaxID=252190 RepID=A0AAN7BXN4_9PEZI|nr:hypothetical protein QBC38DRAFT_466046 [Podospora fimiseda]